jgi:hypothetical protein
MALEDHRSISTCSRFTTIKALNLMHIIIIIIIIRQLATHAIHMENTSTLPWAHHHRNNSSCDLTHMITQNMLSPWDLLSPVIIVRL